MIAVILKNWETKFAFGMSGISSYLITLGEATALVLSIVLAGASVALIRRKNRLIAKQEELLDLQIKKIKDKD